MFWLAYLDKINIANAEVFGLSEDINIDSGTQFNNAVSLLKTLIVGLCDGPAKCFAACHFLRAIHCSGDSFEYCHEEVQTVPLE